jgi:4-carboxymuconolactone decarboxylase
MRHLNMVKKTLVVMAFVLIAAAGARAQPPASAPQPRMGNIPADKMTDEQKAAVATVAPQGNLPAYLQPFLRSPALVQPTKALADYLNRRTGALPPKLLQLPILMISKQWMYTGAWNEHAGFAARDGMNPEIIQAIKEGRRPNNMAPDEQALYDFCAELQKTMGVSDATYNRAVATFGESGVADTVAIMGFYTYLAMFNNATRLPAGQAPAFTPR